MTTIARLWNDKTKENFCYQTPSLLYYFMYYMCRQYFQHLLFCQVDVFVSWLEGEEKKLELHKQTKKPIGIIQSELETFYVRKFH